MAGTKYGSSQNASLLRASAEGVKFLVLLQVSSRLLTFAVNQILLRYLSPELLGISVQFELYMITILYFSRESLRMAVQRYGVSSSPSPVPSRANDKRKTHGPEGVIEGTSAAQSQTVVNLAYIPMPLGILFTAIIAPYYVKLFVSSDTVSQPYFYESVLLYTVATLLELSSEPSFALAQQLLLYKLRAGAESSAALTRCILTCSLTIYSVKAGLGGSGGLGPLPFAVGQLGYAIVLTAVYIRQCWSIARREGFSLSLGKIASHESSYHMSYFYKPLSGLAFSMWMQAAIKHILTQGDSLLIAWLATTHDQGIYALASNYGSLIARMLFQPLEESSRNLFAKLLSQTGGKDDNSKANPNSLRSAVAILQNILRLYSLLSIFFFSVGPPLAPLLLSLVAGSRWSNSAAGSVLSSFCYYIPLLAVNGITEAFVQSVASSKQLQQQSLWMFGFSVGFGLAGYVFLKELGWGAQGLVWANAVNMVLRIVWSWWFMGGYFRRNGVQPMSITMIIPDWRLVGTAAVVGGILRWMHGLDILSLAVIGKVGALGALLVAVCAATEYKYFVECYQMVRSGHSEIEATPKRDSDEKK